MNNRISLHGLTVDRDLFALINDQALPQTGIDPDAFWSGFSDLISELTPRNRALLARRKELETLINEWHAERCGTPHDPESYRAFLYDIGYITPEGPDFTVSTQGVDQEITAIPGPQLVVPVNNARYAINATNARWGSLYDALYGTDVISDQDGVLTSGQYSEARGHRVVAFANGFLALRDAQNHPCIRKEVQHFLSLDSCHHIRELLREFHRRLAQSQHRPGR